MYRITLALCILSTPLWALEGGVQVPVPLAPIGAGQVITSDNLVLQNTPSNQVFKSTVQNPVQAVGQVALRALPAGQPLNTLHLKTPSAVTQGTTVQLVFEKPGLALRAFGRALENANVGESIRVLNVATKSTLMGTVKAPGVVQVN
jgi:flagellar basal body P-ring formation protein FlgA